MNPLKRNQFADVWQKRQRVTVLHEPDLELVAEHSHVVDDEYLKNAKQTARMPMRLHVLIPPTTMTRFAVRIAGENGCRQVASNHNEWHDDACRDNATGDRGGLSFTADCTPCDGFLSTPKQLLKLVSSLQVAKHP